MHTNVSFHRMCAPEYVWLVLPVPSLDMQIFVVPMLHGEHAPLNKFFCSVIRNVASTADNSSCLIALSERGERKPQVFLSLKNVTSFTKIVEFSVVSSVILVHYITQRAKDNKMQSFPSLSSPADVARFLSYLSIWIASPESQDEPLDSLLKVGLCFQTLWACVGAVGCISCLNQVSGGVVALCPGQSSRWHLQVLHELFQLLPVFHVRGCLFARGLRILLQPLFWFGNQLSSSMGQFWGVCNRQARASKTFLYSRACGRTRLESRLNGGRSN